MEHVRKVNTVLTDGDMSNEQETENNQKKSPFTAKLSNRSNLIKMVILCVAVVIIAFIAIYFISRRRKNASVKECVKTEPKDPPYKQSRYTDEQVETFLKNSRENITNIKEELDRKNDEITSLRTTLTQMKKNEKKNQPMKMTFDTTDSDDDSDDDSDNTDDDSDDTENFTDSDDTDDSNAKKRSKKNKKSESKSKSIEKDPPPIFKKEKKQSPPGRSINKDFKLENVSSNDDEKENKELAAILADDGHLDTKNEMNEKKDD